MISFFLVDSDLHWVFGLIAIRLGIGTLNQLIIIIIILMIELFCLQGVNKGIASD